MQSIGDLVPSGSWALLLQGPPKTGKTSIALQFEDPWVADCSGNLFGAVRWLMKQQPERIKRVKYTQINRSATGDLLEVHERWPRLLDATKEALSDSSVKTIVIDDLSAVDQYLQDYIVWQKADSKSKEMTISDWIPYKRLMTKFITSLRSFSKPIIWTAHEENAKDERTGYLFVRINMPGKLADNFGGYFSDVWRTEVTQDSEGKPVYTVRAQPTTQVPQLGNSLGLPPNFVFTWEGFKKMMDK